MPRSRKNTQSGRASKNTAETARRDRAPTLDEVTALVAGTDPTSPASLGPLRRMLFAFGEAAEAAGSTQEQLRTLAVAVRALDDVIEGRAESPDRALSVVRDCIATVAGPDTRSLTLADDADCELVSEYINESVELLEGAEEALLILEASPADQEAINTVFRAFHTIKGTSAFLGLTQVSELAHRAESLFSRMRDGEIRCTGGYADLALRSLDTLKELIGSVQQAAEGGAVTLPPHLDDLVRALSSPDGSEQRGIAGGLVEEGQTGDPPAGRPEAGAPPVASAPPPARSPGKGEGITSSVRVRTARLDRLIEAVGELVIAQSMVAEDESATSRTDPEYEKKIGHMGKIVRELQDLSLSLRMVPLKGLFRKLARLTRDLARAGGKSVEFKSEGEDTEIDRNMVDVIGDPLVHMLRNAIDHGIEPPGVREAHGKSPTGTILLSACHAGGSVVIELRDDGRGLDRDAILQKAKKKGLVPTTEISEAETFGLIFEPGFSTVDKVTELSGRGVGMDVVRRSVEALQGRVEIRSEKNHGTAFVIHLPLTLALSDGMLVRVGAQRYIIPKHSVYECFSPPQSALFTIGGHGEAVRFRNGCLPVIRLARMFNVDEGLEDVSRGLLIVLGDGEGQSALLVDELLGHQQVVVKSLDPSLGRVRGVSGAAILGDGSVGLILDGPDLVALSRKWGTYERSGLDA